MVRTGFPPGKIACFPEAKSKLQLSDCLSGVHFQSLIIFVIYPLWSFVINILSRMLHFAALKSSSQYLAKLNLRLTLKPRNAPKCAPLHYSLQLWILLWRKTMLFVKGDSWRFFLRVLLWIILIAISEAILQKPGIITDACNAGSYLYVGIHPILWEQARKDNPQPHR
jgi:hypothetical protein